MKYKIDEAVICGIRNPSLVIRGWIESAARFMIIKDGDKIIKKIELADNRSKITTLNYIINLNRSTSVQVYFSNGDGVEEKVIDVNSSLKSRIINKFYPRGIMFNQIKGKFSDPLKKELKLLNKNTYDMKDDKSYNRWLLEHNDFSPTMEYVYQPKISIVMPVYNVPGEYLGYCLDSILNQTYQNFEICIADDCSTNEDTIKTLKEYVLKDSRIKVVFREKNGHISRATNSALELVTGEFVGLMDNDDKLEIHALNEVVRVLNENPDLDFIYTDEDKIDMQERRSDPHFKSDFAIHSLYGGNYICHFSVIRKTLIDEIGGFRVGYEGAQDFDLFLRLTEKTNKIYHIPKILYHWRMIPGSTAVGGDGAKNYAGEAGKRALEDYFKNKDINVKVDIVISTQYFVEYVVEKEPKVSVIVVANKDESTILRCIDHIDGDNVYNNYNIIIINNTNSNLNHFQNENLIIIEVDKNINSTINSIVKEIDSEYIIFSDENNRYETIDWMYNLVGYASRPENGAIGGKVIGRYGLVRRSGLIINNKTILLNACQPTYREDYGNNGRLLVPYNYSIVENEIFIIKKDNFIDLNDSFNYEFGCYDLQLKLANKGKQNIFVPQIIVENDSVDGKLDESQLLLFKNKWQDKLDYDRYYNKNLSLIEPFRLDISNYE